MPLHISTSEHWIYDFLVFLFCLFSLLSHTHSYMYVYFYVNEKGTYMSPCTLWRSEDNFWWLELTYDLCWGRVPYFLLSTAYFRATGSKMIFLSQPARYYISSGIILFVTAFDISYGLCIQTQTIKFARQVVLYT